MEYSNFSNTANAYIYVAAAPSAPTGFTTTKQLISGSNYRLTFNWNKVNRAYGYKVYYNINGGAEQYTGITVTPGTVTTGVMTMMMYNWGRSLNFYVRAYNQWGNGAPSNYGTVTD